MDVNGKHEHEKEGNQGNFTFYSNSKLHYPAKLTFNAYLFKLMLMFFIKSFVRYGSWQC